MFYLSDLLIIGFTYVFMMSFENAIHKASHYKGSGGLYRWHKMHHKDYPPTRVESDVFIDSLGNYYLQNYFLRYILIIYGIVYMFSSFRTFSIVFIEGTSYVIIINHLHEQFHLKQSWLQNYKWFQLYKRNHLLHHMKQNKNYSFMTTKIDKLQNSYLCDND